MLSEAKLSCRLSSSPSLSLPLPPLPLCRSLQLRRPSPTTVHPQVLVWLHSACLLLPCVPLVCLFSNPWPEEGPAFRFIERTPAAILKVYGSASVLLEELEHSAAAKQETATFIKHGRGAVESGEPLSTTSHTSAMHDGTERENGHCKAACSIQR